ncbi:NAD(P)-dependent alcohol dehydrogenase [Actinomadura rayongensis]|uniref:Alcohol dehydrogenase catalytic domain-containing protein n=1 Tax=Actinomadura rayongensis TaxID=1429076 RepID=A0A6I4W4D0_9ACTN|nr:NAD(P)-dependent alcohol dehydrogenase [Actinomadura rayongensis]MXQ64298.1 alcohol dehydrogenase catalytic domain-containing protein [Actinomadura rayongensis]
MATPTTAAVARTGADTLHWENVRLDEPSAGEALVRIVGAGICHTDLSVLAGRLPVPLPAVLGHEGAGIVTAVGPGVTGVRPGDQVVLSFNSCGLCAKCRTGRPTQCATYWPLNFGAARPDGTTPVVGADGGPLGGLFFGQSSLAAHALVAEHSMVRVDAADEDELAMLAPIGCGVQTGAGAILNVLRPAPGDTVAVFGAGAVGLSAVMAARLTGARRIIAVDVVASRLALAAELGATDGIDAGRENLAERLAALAGPTGVTHIVESTGVAALLELAIEAVAADGTVAVIGAPAAGTRASFNVNALIDGRTIRGVTEGGSDRVTFIPALADLVRQGRLPVDRLIRSYRPDQLAEAIEDARSGRTVKPVIRFEGAL